MRRLETWFLAWGTWKSLALVPDPPRGRREPADANVGRRTDTLKCADAVEACRLSAAPIPARHRRGAAQRRPYSPAPSRRPRGIVKLYALAASSCLVAVHVPIKGALKQETASSRNGSNGGPVTCTTSRRPRGVAT